MRWLVLFALGACLSDPTVECGSIQCPAGNVCTPSGCASPDQIEACRDPLATACSTPAITTGVCVDGICQGIVCGDNRIVGPEACDDGNQSAGDMCSADCLSNETCGNGYVDFVNGEQCDNLPAGLSYDGCAAACRVEFPNWRDVSPTTPPARYNAAIAFDARRKVTVMVGGFQQANTTFEWNGASWRRLDIPGPSQREGAAAAYDAARERVVLFGGRLSNTSYGDTWLYDGDVWTKQTPAMSPPARGDAAMAYDPVRAEVVMFGGANTQLTSTWVWNGTTWTEFPTTNVPTTDTAPLMAWDESSDRLILVASGRTFAWIGTAWQELAPTTPAPIRPSAAMAEDGAGILFSGSNSMTDTWRWINGNWTNLPNGGPARSQHMMAYDRERMRVVLFGGLELGAKGDTWEWTGTWSLLTPVTSPPPRNGPSLVYQPMRGRVLLYGGGQLEDTWEWDGGIWIRHLPSPRPGPRTNAAIAATGDRVVLFGGTQGGATLDKTWTWDGATWAEQFPANVPRARQGAAMAYDIARARVVMFGGVDPGLQALPDTWEWNGTNWLPMTPAHVPPKRAGAAMGYDAVRKRIVMFGGIDPGTLLDDTWEWDGTDWTDRTPAVSPTPGQSNGAWDARRGTFVIYGSSTIGNLETWEWDGSTWTPLLAGNPPSARVNSAIAYDAMRGDHVMFGRLSPPTNETLVLRFEAQGFAQDRCRDFDTDGDGLVGCADPDCWATCTPLCPPRATCN